MQSYVVSTAASPTAASPGDVVTYTVTVVNTGATAYSAAALTDDLSDVLDDADVVASSVTASAGSATIAGAALSWTGPLAVAPDAGSTVTIQYQVRVDDPDKGNQQVASLVSATAPGGSCVSATGCATSLPVRSYTVLESAGATAADPGQTITYTVTVANTGAAAYAGGAAGFTVDLSGSLDDASLVAGSISASSGSAAISGDQLIWFGPLAVAPAAGSTVTVTYSVQVDSPDPGNELVTNALSATTPGGSCATPTGCVVSTGVRSYSATVSADAATVTPGGTVGYTITITNTGQADYTGSTASVHDDLTGVGDDAAYVPMSASASSGTMQVTAGAVSWAGPLPIGASAVVHFQVRVHSPDTGDGDLTSVVSASGAGGSCVSACSATTGVQRFAVTASAGAASAVPGQPLTYAITAANTGRVAYPAAPAADAAGFSDDLSDITDDATVIAGSVSASVGTATIVGDTLTWTGPLAVAPAGGSKVVVTFSVVLDQPDTGNRRLTNQIKPVGPGAVATAAGSAGPVLGVRSFSIQASMAATAASPGSVVHFTFVVTATGTAAFSRADPAAFEVKLGGALAGARYNGDGSAGVSYAPGDPVLERRAGRRGVDHGHLLAHLGRRDG